MAITEEAVLEALKKVYDPEMGLNVVDLGLIYSVEIEEPLVKVLMTLTARGCPLHDVMSAGVHNAVLAVPGVEEAEVEVVWEPPWHHSMISDEGRKKLKGTR